MKPSPSIKITFDPTNHYPHASQSALLAGGGLIVEWVLQGLTNPRPLKETLTELYGFGQPLPMGGTIDEAFVYHYPGDPPFPPLFLIEGTQPEHASPTTFIMYRHSILAIIEKGTPPFITRMD